MKKVYAKPETIEVVFETQGVIATSLQICNDANLVDTSIEGNQLTNKYNGGWNSSNWE